MREFFLLLLASSKKGLDVEISGQYRIDWLFIDSEDWGKPLGPQK